MQNYRPHRPHRPHGEPVNDRIKALLNRVQGIKRGSECSRPTRFDVQGEANAQRIAAADAAKTTDAAQNETHYPS